MHLYERDGAAIYRQSFAMIRAEADLTGFRADEEQVAVRMIHAAGMVDLAALIRFSDGFVASARAALAAGAPILCDARMVSEGITRARLPADCRAEFQRQGASPALQLPFSSEMLSRARRALAQEWGKEPVVGGSGGSIPIVGEFKRGLGMDSLMIGFGLDDDRIHSPNEKYELSSFHKGARSWARVLDALAK